jgi:16S rRNA (guanine1516-N2)-methyltransferase
MVNSAELIVDFTEGAVRHRFKFGGGRGQALSKACGLSKGQTPSIVDATAGLGRDSFFLASLGAEVTLIERSKHMFKLLEEGISRARGHGYPFSDIMGRMTLIYGDARDVLPLLAPDVVLVDPMHPPRGKSALVKIEMRQLRDIVGGDPDALDLMKTALLVAKKRVVLKWPLRADPMPGLKARSHQILGKSIRFDVFMILDYNTMY